MKKIISLVMIIGAFAMSMSAQTNYFVVGSGGTQTKFNVATVDSVLFINRSEMKLKADTVFDLNVQLPASSGYDATEFTLPVKNFYKRFGYTSAGDCVTAVYNDSVKFYFYDGTTNEIYSEDHSKGTANSGGCWFDANGSVCSWGTNAVLFIEPSITTSKISFKLGHYPDKTVDGQQYTLLMGLQNGKSYVGFRIHMTVGEVVKQAFTYDTYLEIDSAGYDQKQYAADTTGICSTFGMTLEELVNAIGEYKVNLFPVDGDGNIDKSQSLMEGDGYWFTAEGTPCAEDNTAKCIKIEPTFEGFNFFFTQAPFACKLGDIITIKVALSSSDVDVVLTYNINIVKKGYHPSGFTNDGKNNITVYGDVSSGDYALFEVPFDGAAIAADLGLADEAAVISGLSDGTVTFANLNADQTESGKTTANNGGGWYDANGNVCSWGTNAVVYAEPTSAKFASGLKETVGQYPGHCKSGDVYKFYQAFICSDKKHVVSIEINFK